MVIDSYEFGRMVIDGRVHVADLMIHPDRVDPSWWRAQGHRLGLPDLEAALSEAPEVLIIGTGFYGAMEVPDDVRRAVEQRGIELHVARTGEAVGLFRSLPRGKRAVAAFHLTC